MAIRTDVVLIEKQAEDLKLDIWDLEMQVFRFDNKINAINSFEMKSLKLIQECIFHYRDAKNILRSFLKVEENKYINETILQELDGNLGRIDGSITKTEKELLEKADTLEFMGKGKAGNIKITTLKNILTEAMENIVIRPLINSLKKYGFYEEQEQDVTGEDGNTSKQKVSKDVFLWKSYLFQELIPAAQSIGAVERQQTIPPKNLTINNPNPTSTSTSYNASQKPTEQPDEPKEESLYELEEDKDELF